MPQFYVLFFRLKDNFAGDILSRTSIFPVTSSPSSPEKITARSGSSERECIICMCNDADESLPCTHAFCHTCIQKWSLSSKECPICRRECQEERDAWIITEMPTTTEMATDVLTLAENLNTEERKSGEAPRARGFSLRKRSHS